MKTSDIGHRTSDLSRRLFLQQTACGLGSLALANLLSPGLGAAELPVGGPMSPRTTLRAQSYARDFPQHGRCAIADRSLR
jgi:hypothetical protein